MARVLPADAESRIQACHCVCVDVISALLTRDLIYPQHILQRLYSRLASDNDMSSVLGYLDAAAFVARRLQAERRADPQANDKTAALSRIWSRALGLGPEQTAMGETLAEEELGIELASLQVREQGKALVHQARGLGKPVIAFNTSWLSASRLSPWLHERGVTVDRIIDLPVQREQGRKMALGADFDGICPSRAHMLLVCGKNAVGFFKALSPEAGVLLLDDIPSRLMGLRQAHWDTLPLAASRSLALAANSMASATGPNESNQDLLRTLGYSVLGPCLGSFAAWIGHLAKAARADRIVFSSRDGWLPYQVAGKLSWTEQHEISYGYFSRRALYIPSFAGGLNTEDLVLLTGGLWPTTVGQLLRRAGLSPAEFTSDIQSMGFANAAAMVSNLEERMCMARVFRRVESHVKAVGKRELEQFAEYWVKSGMGEAKRILFVDIGWRGTLQSSLQRCLNLLGMPVEIVGAYLGLLHMPVSHRGGTALGWLCDETCDPNIQATIGNAIPVFEACFQANQSSVKGYLDGQPLFSSAARSREICDPLQAAALDYCRDALPLLNEGASHPIMGQPLLHLAANPSPDEAALLGRYVYADGFGDMDQERALLCIPDRVIDPRKLLRMLRDRHISSWQPGFDALIAERGWLPLARIVSNLGSFCRSSGAAFQLARHLKGL